jgi:hypothetical protein
LHGNAGDPSIHGAVIVPFATTGDNTFAAPDGAKLTASRLGGRTGLLGIACGNDGSMPTAGGVGLSFPGWPVELQVCPPE